MSKTSVVWAIISLCVAIVAYTQGTREVANRAHEAESVLKVPAKSGELTQNELFTKKTECAKYEKQIRDGLEQDQYVIEALYQIFYSPVKNTCISAIYALYSAHGTVQEGEILKLEDILTGESVWLQSYRPAMKYWEADAILDQQIAALK